MYGHQQRVRTYISNALRGLANKIDCRASALDSTDANSVGLSRWLGCADAKPGEMQVSIKKENLHELTDYFHQDPDAEFRIDFNKTLFEFTEGKPHAKTLYPMVFIKNWHGVSS